MAITPISVTRKLTSSAPTGISVAVKPTMSAAKTITPVTPSSDSQMSITGGQSAPVTVIGATRKLTAPLPVTPIQVTPERTFLAAKTIAPVVSDGTVSLAKAIAPAVYPITNTTISSYKIPKKTQTTTTSVPSVVVAERTAVQQILSKNIQNNIAPKTVPQVPDVSTTVSREFKPQAATAKIDTAPVNFNVPSATIPSSDVSKKITPAYTAVATVLPIAPAPAPAPAPTYQPRTSEPAVVTPIYQPRTSEPAVVAPTYQPRTLATAPVQDPGVMTSFAPLLDPGISAQDDMTTPGVTPPDFMRVRGREERYYGREPFVETNVITPQVSMPTQVSTQAPAQSYQVPIDQGYDPNKIQYTPGTTSYIGGQAQPGASAPIDSAYNTIKILTLAGVGLGALYWLISKAAPKVEFKSNRKNRKRTRK
jgi:hypothetical protein